VKLNNFLKYRENPSLIKMIVSLLLLVGVIYLFAFTDVLELLKSQYGQHEFSFKSGKIKVTLHDIVKGLIFSVVVFWSTSLASKFIEKRIFKMESLRAGTRDLVIKLVHISLFLLAFMVVLDSVGIDLTALTVFSGAAGIGLGFGLQKTASNFISGIILLFEKTIEPGNLIELSDGTLGFVKKTKARYTLIETFDTREIIVPNEDLMTSKVTNLTMTNSSGRLDIEVGISYKSDVHLAKKIILEAATEHPLCLTHPEPQCYLTKFGDSSVDFLLHFWIGDVAPGRLLPKSEVMLSIWDKLKEHNIEIPFPQRDLHIKSSDIGNLKN
jgi:small-conductance mechanosensitive channel